MKQGYKETEIGEIPVEWEVKELSDIAQISGGSTPSTSNDDYWNGTIPWATPTDITKLGDGVKYLTKTDNAITEKALKECNLSLFPVESVLMTSRASIGFTAISKYPLTTNQGFCIFHQFKNIHNIYLSYYIESIRPILLKHSSGSTFKEISKSSIKKIKLPLPPLPEQKKIAEILSSVDEAIRATQAVIDQTKKLKQGLLNQLLTKGIGHKKFKMTEIGETPVEWEVKRLENLCEVITKGTTPTSVGYNFDTNGINFIKIESITSQGEFLPDKFAYISNSCHAALKRSQLLEGDILFSIAGALGRTAIVNKEILPANTNQAISIIRLKKSQSVSIDYMYMALSSYEIVKSIQLLKSGNAQLNLSLEQIQGFNIPLPPLPEQLKIAEILFSVDETIRENIQQIEQLKATKSGLMQDLLAGKRRVKYAQP